MEVPKPLVVLLPVEGPRARVEKLRVWACLEHPQARQAHRVARLVPQFLAAQV